MTSPRRRRRWPALARTGLAASLIASPGIAAGYASDTTSDVAVKAALIYNFAKFAEWPALPADAPIAACVVGDDRIAAALVETVRGQQIAGHGIEVTRPQDVGGWRTCHLLYIADAAIGRSAGGIDTITSLPVLTISDGKDFARAGGIIELYIDAGRMRFAINVDAANRSGLHLSSRLLGLAKLVRNPHGQ